MFYHARVVLKPERAKENHTIAFELDMTRAELLSNIARPFMGKKQFFCGGVVVDPSRVQEVRFNETQQSSTDLAPFIEARRRSHLIVSGTPPEQGIIWEGNDITRAILDEASEPVSAVVSAKSKVSNDRVFIVHGHDQSAVDQTELLVHRFGLTPVILRDAPTQGRTVIEKFETHSNVGCAIVLLTPDDVGGIDPAHLSPRARQNVIWEWGYLVARLGRKNVICIYKSDVEMPSDLHGLVTINVSDDIREKAEEIKRELRAAGYQIK